MMMISTLALSATGCAKTKEAKAPYRPTMPTEMEASEIYVEKIDGLSEDFIRGMDVSSILSEEAAGVKYYDADGKEQDVFRILADSGVNYARIRVWNDPFDKDGNGYGGGNCDAKSAAKLGARAAEYGMKTCVDFHYSDFWADPAKQMVPKAWADMNLEEKKEALTAYTGESLKTIYESGTDIGMVQIGNEINYGLAGESDFDNELELLDAASKAVRAFAKEHSLDIQIVVHFTEVDNASATKERAARLKDAGIDYDIFGISYYTYWHGTYENMIQTLRDIEDTYRVKTCIMETSYLYTGADADGSANSISEADTLPNYPATVQGQANNLRDVMAAAQSAHALGVFYWEGCWIGAFSDYQSNKDSYEKYGCGWASSYAGAYDPKDAGAYYGGCSWDNQALFDAEGKKLPSLDVFRFVYHGAKGGALEVLAVPDLEIEIAKGSSWEAPQKVDAVYNDTSISEQAEVTWNQEELNAVDRNRAGVYTVSGKAAGYEMKMTVRVLSENLLVNGNFDDADASMWQVTSQNGENPTDIQTKESDAHSGENAFHWWSASAMNYEMYQDVTIDADGVYSANAFIQGGDVGDDAVIYLFVQVTSPDKTVTEYKSDAVRLNGWVNWQNPVIGEIQATAGSKIRVGMHVECAANGWGTMDDFELVQ